MDCFRLLKNLPLSFDILIPFRNQKSELLKELAHYSIPVYYSSERIVLIENIQFKIKFSQDWWKSCVTLPIAEFSNLKGLKNWGCYYHAEVFPQEKKLRAQLRNLELKRIDWKPNHPFNFHFFTWTVLNNSIIYCENPEQRFPLGWHEFNEDKTNPPNRAYLKLWEIFLNLDLTTVSKETCLELGASPGGWTWVLAEHFKKIYAIDRSPLDSRLMKKTNIIFQQGNAFTLNLKDYQEVDWLFSDLICTPEKLESLVDNWLLNSNVKNLVCTIKFKGSVDFKYLDHIQKKFEAIGQSRLIHLYHNKNEVTWLLSRNRA